MATDLTATDVAGETAAVPEIDGFHVVGSGTRELGGVIGLVAGSKACFDACRVLSRSGSGEAAA
jgi:hypothetical protein